MLGQFYNFHVTKFEKNKIEKVTRSCEKSNSLNCPKCELKECHTCPERDLQDGSTLEVKDSLGLCYLKQSYNKYLELTESQTIYLWK